MLKWFKKKSDVPETKLESDALETKTETVFPAAQEILEKTEKHWTAITDEEILAEIQISSNLGYRSAFFRNAKISEQTCTELRQKGYHITIYTLFDDTPYFEVSW